MSEQEWRELAARQLEQFTVTTQKYRAENERLREKAKRVVETSDKVEIDRDYPQDAYYEWCAAVDAMREALAGDAE